MLFDVDARTGVGWHQVIHIHSLCKALRRYAREVERIASRGESMDGTRYVPVSHESWERWVAPLAALVETIDRIAARAGDAPAKDSSPSFGATRTAISGRLSEMEEIAGDLDPQRLQRAFGSLPDGVVADLETATATLVAQLAEVQRIVRRRHPLFGGLGMGIQPLSIYLRP